ncbi:hypothetical protein LCGC14_0164570 [marine sediment metagenome]|uniref:Uncharacterized protein n=1 Tax=marine sediment metagenome TaxID=412755 RepID=A0A0F9XWN9_9ZZZZ
MPHGEKTRIGIEIFNAFDLTRGRVEEDFEPEALAYREWPSVPIKGDRIYLSETDKTYEVLWRTWSSLVDGKAVVITTGAYVTLAVQEVDH